MTFTTQELFIKLKAQIELEHNYYENQINLLKEANQELNDPLIKDKTIAKYKKERDKALEDLNRGFGITKEQEIEIKNWQHEHIKTKHNGNAYAGAIGGRFSYTFVPCSLGIIGIVKCSCGEEFEFQNDI